METNPEEQAADLAYLKSELAIETENLLIEANGILAAKDGLSNT